MKRQIYAGIKRGTLVEIVARTEKRVTFALATVPTSVKVSCPIARFEADFIPVTFERSVTGTAVS